MNEISANWTNEERRKDFASLALLIQTTVKEAVAQAVQEHPLTADEVHWVRMAIQAEAERAELRKAIINKTLAGLVWIAIVAAGGWLLDYVSSHWK